jgi:twitching motility two-component system response regulator PilH
MAKVMVVDDAYSELKMMEGILKSAGLDVCFPDGDYLEERMIQERPDVLLPDIVMPNRKGYEVLRSLKRDERTKGTPVVLVSSKNQESDRVWGRRQGADEYLGKPFTAEQLVMRDSLQGMQRIRSEVQSISKKIKSFGGRSLAQARRPLGQRDQGRRGPDQERPERHAGSYRGHGTGDARGRVRLSDDGAGG